MSQATRLKSELKGLARVGAGIDEMENAVARAKMERMTHPRRPKVVNLHQVKAAMKAKALAQSEQAEAPIRMGQAWAMLRSGLKTATFAGIYLAILPIAAAWRIFRAWRKKVKP